MGKDAQPDNYMYHAYADYYGADDYGDQLIKAAFGGTATSFPGMGNQDFSSMGADGKEQVIKKATAYINTLMYVMYEVEDALVVCKKGPGGGNIGGDYVDDIHAWDEAVCFYTGSLPPGEGVLAHRLAEKRCADWGTCNDDSTSPLNDKVFELWNEGQEQILAGDCDGARATTDAYAKLWIQPLIQGTMSYAYEVGAMGGGEKEAAEGAVFMAAVVPAIHMHNADAASVIYENMKFGATPDYKAVKEAFESVYDDIGVTCEEIGGFMNEDGTYYEGMEPCGGGEVATDGEATADEPPTDKAPAASPSGGASLAALAAHAVMMIAAVVGFA
jgi:Notch-like protein